MKRTTMLACLGIAIGVSVVGAQANTVTYSDSIPLASTNWSHSIALPKFDPALGTLNSIQVTLDGRVVGSAAYENTDGAKTVRMHLQATETLQRPDFSTLVVSIPLVSTVDDVPVYDGVFDFAGTSGKTYSDLSAHDIDSFTTSSALDKALFTGAGYIVLPVVAEALSFGTGSGGQVFRFSTSASAEAEVTYDYTGAIPEPITAVTIILALGAAGWRLNRRRLEQAQA